MEVSNKLHQKQSTKCKICKIEKMETQILLYIIEHKEKTPIKPHPFSLKIIKKYQNSIWFQKYKTFDLS